MSGYEPGEVERFTLSRDRIHGGEIRGEVALKPGGKVGMTLGDYYAIGCEMARLRRANAELVQAIEDVRRVVG